MIIIFFIFSILLFTKPIHAIDINVICPNDPSPNPTSLSCSLTPDNLPLFDEKDILPGFLTDPAHLISVQNQDDNNPCFLVADTTKTDGNELLLTGDHRLNLSIISDSTLLYSGPLIFDNLNLDQVDIGSTKNYFWTISFPQSADNDYQALSATFDINLNFTCADNPNWKPPVTNPASGVYLSEYVSTGNEWVEIFNNNDFPIILDGWQIDDDPTGGMIPKNIPYVNIPSKSFYVYDIAGNFFNNNHDYVILINNLGQVVESTTYDHDSVSLSWSKQADGLWCLASPTKLATNNPCADISQPLSDSSPSVLGASNSNPSPPQCNDPVPNTPSNLTATISGSGQVSLNWTAVSSPLTSYLLAYGPNDTDFKYGNPNLGLSTSYLVSGLSHGAQYCFYVRAQNGCMPGSPSNIVCVNQGSTIPIVENSPPSGFKPDILGDTDTIQDSFDLGDIKGDIDQPCRRYLPLLFIIALLLNSFYFSQKPKDNFILPLLISSSSVLVDWFILKRTCCLVIDIFCNYFYIGGLISFILPFLIFRKKSN